MIDFSKIEGYDKVKEDFYLIALCTALLSTVKYFKIERFRRFVDMNESVHFYIDIIDLIDSEKIVMSLNNLEFKCREYNIDIKEIKNSCRGSSAAQKLNLL